jgi:arylsulfatase
MLEFDWSVGEVLSALKEMGADNNTLVVFTSDNGPWLNYGNHSGTCDGFREGKCTAFEGGKRVPCLVRWPGRIPAGTVCNRFAATLDLFPTVGKYAGAESRSDLDGVDISALFEGGPEADPRREFWYYYDRKLCGVTDGRWKLVLPHEYRSYEGFVPGKDGYPGEYGKKWTDKALYDMQRDPGERVNALKLYPEIAQQLEKIAEKARADLGDTDSLKDGKSLNP